MANSNNSFMKSIGEVKSIEGVPLRVAKKIYFNDTWFTNETELPKRFISFTNENGNIKVSKVNDPKEGYYQVSKVKKLSSNNSNNSMGMSKQGFINMCFSVFGNNCPYKKFQTYYEKNGHTFPDSGNDKAFLAHIAWVMCNSWGLDSDPVVTKVRALAKMETTDPLKQLKDDDLLYPSLFESAYAKAYFKFIEDPEDRNEHVIRGMIGLDSANAELYINNIISTHPQSGGRKTKKINKNKKSVKSRKQTKARKH